MEGKVEELNSAFSMNFSAIIFFFLGEKSAALCVIEETEALSLSLSLSLDVSLFFRRVALRCFLRKKLSSEIAIGLYGFYVCVVITVLFLFS